LELYPHWLDGEFVRIASNATGPDQDVRDSIRALKLHALLGTQFILNDVQVFDSAAVLAVFGDKSAREFLGRDRSFFDLRVDPDPWFGDNIFALAGRGLTRTRTPGWLSSMFIADPTPMKRLADEIIDEIQRQNYLEPTRPSAVVQEYPQYAGLLQSVRHAVHYFGTIDSPQVLVAPSGERTNYYRVLCELRERTLTPEDERRTALTLEFIDREIDDPEKRHARSNVWKALRRVADRTEHECIRNNVVQAWNYATQQTLLPDGGSVGVLPDAVSPAPYFDSLTDTLVPIREGESNGPLAVSPDYSLLPCEIDDISWDDIRRVRDGTSDTMERLRRARYSGHIDVLSQPLRTHLVAVGRVLEPPRKVSGVTYLLKIGGAVLAVLGDPTSWVSWGSSSMIVSDLIRDVRQDTAPWRERRALTDTLFKAAAGRPR
jgi:hypothetical protein